MAGHAQELIFKKVKKTAHAHHGGAWKIAYADFVTAMMAFFLLLWLISMTTPEQKKGIADYFAPPTVSPSESGAGGVLGGIANANDPGAKLSGTPVDAKTFTAPANDQQGPLLSVKSGSQALKGPEQNATDPLTEDIQSSFDQQFKSAAASIRQAWQAMPQVTEIAQNLRVEETPDGLSIKILDAPGQRMFPDKSKYPIAAVRTALAAMAPILARLPNQIAIAGHTAGGTAFDDPHYGAWELSMDRADQIRQILGDAGLGDDRIASVTGDAAQQPLFVDDPFLAANERVEITVLYEAPSAPPTLVP
jgi:chemotaxis protein MotB